MFALPPKEQRQPVLLGDLGAYASLSGYRFRLLPQANGGGRTVVVVGEPGETVDVTYLVPATAALSASASGWLVRRKPVVIGHDGRQLVTMV